MTRTLIDRITSAENESKGGTMQGYTDGANREQQNKIRRMHDDGRTVEEISRALTVMPSCVESFVKKFSGARAKKSSPTPKQTARKKTTPKAPPVEQVPPPIPPPLIPGEESLG